MLRSAGVSKCATAVVRVKPAMTDTWRSLEREQVVPALKKAGVKQYTVFETLVGDQTSRAC